ncbi:sulfurtransferase [Bradyrhizobium betae]
MSHPTALITTGQLAAILGDPNLRLYDCTTYNEPVPPGSDVPYRAVPGDKTFAAGHIPGADFLDLQGEFSDTSSQQFFMMPDVAQLEAAFGRHGLDADKTIVLYSIGTMMWATRFWWMLRSLGVDAHVLDGGFDKWKEEGRPVETGAPKGLSRHDLQGGAARRPLRRQDDREGTDRRSLDRHRQRTRPAISSRSRAEPLRPARPRSRQRQRVGRNRLVNAEHRP